MELCANCQKNAELESLARSVRDLPPEEIDRITRYAEFLLAESKRVTS